MTNSYSETLKDALKDAISSAMYSCEDYVYISQDLDTAKNMQETFSAWVNEDFRQIVEDYGFSSKLETLKDKCAEIFAEKIQEAVDEALAIAEDALKDSLGEIEQDLLDIVDKQELGE